MATLNQEGINKFLYVKVSNAYVMAGCANSISVNEASSTIDVKCDSNGVKTQSFYGTSTVEISIGGLFFDYDTNEETTNFSVADWYALKAAQTKAEVLVLNSGTVGGKGRRYTGCVVKSVDVTHANGEASTYSISLSADDSADFTIPA